MKKYFLIAFLVVILGGSSLIYFYPQEEDSSTVKSEPVKSIDSTADKKIVPVNSEKKVEPLVIKNTPITASNIYTNAKYGFSINLPNNWVSTTSVDTTGGSEAAHIQFYDKNDLKDIPDSAITVSVSKFKDTKVLFENYYGKTMTEEEIVNSLLDYESEVNNEWVLESVSKIKINNIIAYEAKAHYLAKIDSRPVTVREYVLLPEGEHMYVIFSYSYSDLWNKYGDGLVKAIKSFNYLK